MTVLIFCFEIILIACGVSYVSVGLYDGDFAMATFGMSFMICTGLAHIIENVVRR